MTKDTILIFLSDNGPSMPAPGAKGEWQPRYNGGMKGRKAEVDEGGVRVPLFTRWLDHIRPNTEVLQIAAHIDLFPTILQLCDIPMPETLPQDGRCLVPLLDGNTEGWPDRMIFSHQNRFGETRMTPGSVRVAPQSICGYVDVQLPAGGYGFADAGRNWNSARRSDRDSGSRSAGSRQETRFDEWTGGDQKMGTAEVRAGRTGRRSHHHRDARPLHSRQAGHGIKKSYMFDVWSRDGGCLIS